MTDLFSPQGIARWQERLNTSARFAEASVGWNGRIVLLERGAAVSRRTWIRVGDARCLEAREAVDADEAAADFVLAASSDTWRDLTSGRTTPVMAGMTGKLSLVKGELLALLPHARAAAELLAAGED